LNQPKLVECKISIEHYTCILIDCAVGIPVYFPLSPPLLIHLIFMMVMVKRTGPE